MVTLLVIILATFVSLGLQGALLGSAWPVMHLDLGVPIGNAGIIAMISSASAITAAFLSDKIVQRFNTGLIAVSSVTMTASALLGFSFSYNFIVLCLLAVPLGFGGGTVDATLNNFVALHYKAKHMNWLHSFWGLGALIGPLIMAFSLNFGSWSLGYRAISILQFTMVLILIGSLPLWRRFAKQERKEKRESVRPSKRLAVAMPGAKLVLITFFLYSSIEAVVDLWASTYLVTQRFIAAETAAQFMSIYYVGLTAGRFASGFLSEKFSSRWLIHLGQCLIGLGALSLLLPLGANFAAFSLLLIGLGCAPIFPSLMHETPKNFGRIHSQSLIGLQMTFAYIGATFMPPLFGAVGQELGYWIFPFFVIIFVAVIGFTVMRMYGTVTRRED
ncbi:MAG: MFS transporter [Turicibacter sp.]|nr:MFS transporter [Turicibacter sp.]